MNELAQEFYDSLNQPSQALQFILQSSIDGFWYWDPASPERLWINETFWRTLGYSEQETPTWESVIFSNDLVHLQTYSAPSNLTLRFRHKNGATLWLHCHIEEILNLHNEKRIVMSLHNISDLIDTKQKYSVLEQQNELVMQVSGTGIWRCRCNTNIIELSEPMTPLLGIQKPPHHFITHSELDSIIHPDDLARVQETLFTPNIEQTFDCEFRIQRDRRWSWLKTRGKVIVTNPDHSPQEWLAICYDISESRSYQHQLEVAQKQASAANSTKSRFLANISHELRTPLAAIMGLSELGLKQEANSQQNFNKILNASNRLMDVINDILDFSHLEAEEIQPNLQVFSMQMLLSQLKNQYLLEAERKGIHFNIELDEQIAHGYRSDLYRLKQILSNLLNNAVKFTERGLISLTATLLEQTSNAHRIRFEVKDTGIGISQAQQSQLFKPFEQMDNSNSREYGGTGLGLVISDKLLKLLGGDRFHIDSKLGKGSCFSFEILLATCSKEELKHLLIEDENALLKTRLEGRVLLVEDIDINREVTANQLQSIGLEVETANDGREAVSKCRQAHYDLILMDIQMPVMSGYEATRVIREIGLEIPIIALTAAAMIEDHDKAIQAGMNDHLAKPVHLAMLIVTLSQYLPQKSISKTPAPEDTVTPEPIADELVIDEAQALHQLNGNRGLYEKLLKQFADKLDSEFKELPSQLTALHLNADDDLIQQAQRLNHSLKGVSANLHLTLLAQAATQIDTTLKQQQAPSLDTIKRLEQSMQISKEHIIALTQAPVQAEATKPEAIVPTFTQIINKLQLYEFMDEAELEIARKEFTHRFGDERANQAVELISEFEFEQALQIIGMLPTAMKTASTAL